jgi:transposase
MSRCTVTPLPSIHQITWILLQGPRPTDEKTKAWAEEFRQHVPEVDQVARLANEFLVLLRERQSEELSNWIAQATQSPLASFAAGLRRDFAAVQGAFSLPWSQGQVEG